MNYIRVYGEYNTRVEKFQVDSPTFFRPFFPESAERQV